MGSLEERHDFLLHHLAVTFGVLAVIGLMLVGSWYMFEFIRNCW